MILIGVGEVRAKSHINVRISGGRSRRSEIGSSFEGKVSCGSGVLVVCCMLCFGGGE